MLQEHVAPASSEVPALLIWGELDQPTSSKAKAHERLFATHQMIVVPNAPHPCYLKEPAMFNALLVQFAGGASAHGGALPSSPSSVPTLKVAADWRGGRSKKNEMELRN